MSNSPSIVSKLNEFLAYMHPGPHPEMPLLLATAFLKGWSLLEHTPLNQEPPKAAPVAVLEHLAYGQLTLYRDYDPASLTQLTWGVDLGRYSPKFAFSSPAEAFLAAYERLMARHIRNQLLTVAPGARFRAGFLAMPAGPQTSPSGWTPLAASAEGYCFQWSPAPEPNPGGRVLVELLAPDGHAFASDLAVPLPGGQANVFEVAVLQGELLAKKLAARSFELAQRVRDSWFEAMRVPC